MLAMIGGAPGLLVGYTGLQGLFEGVRVAQLYNSGLARISALPGVESVGAGLTLPYGL